VNIIHKLAFFLTVCDSLTMKFFFTENLLKWFATNHRPLPWKGEKNPYLIWLSEIILQQTTVRQGLPYYERFVEKYPSVKLLADAPEDEVMKLWEGLGYYSRARNLHATAKHIAYNLNASFPNTYDDILKLKGVGAYTAAAIVSFAYDLPHAVLDGNVYRVLSRFFGIEIPIDSTQAKKIFTKLANELLDKNRPADFNQAMMDFGATHCTPSNPNCKSCLLNTQCFAFQNKKTGELPIKSKTLIKRDRFFNYLIINQGVSVFIKKRLEKDIWQNLYDFPLIETDRLVENLSSLDEIVENTEGGYLRFSKKSQPYKQVLTHQNIYAVFWEFEADKNFLLKGGNFLKVEKKNLSTFAFPKVMDTFFNKKVLTLF
jgi:A/G-specific adenine glycosylase